MTRMPEVVAPKLGNTPNLVTIDAEIPGNANGVLYALGAFSGGLTTYVKDGMLCYEYNLFEIQRTRIVSKQKLPTGKVRIEVETTHAVPKPGGPLNVTLRVNGAVVAKGQVPISAAVLFTANDCLDIGTDLGSPVSLDYYDKAPFAFNGRIHEVKVKYL
jgi:arylsulfatase